ncbi:uncharacterized protein LOC136095380 isoform X2 [Hydra vulgaris]|uniref:uncharacterized protein LOC136095380 isoform X2 n=1 Tax=Hydra vulgaris TaxID=6087 RepID=UPI0032EA3180
MAFKKARSFRARRKVTINVVGTCKRKVTKSWYSSNITNIQPLKEALLVNNKVVEKNDLCIKVADILNQKYEISCLKLPKEIHRKFRKRHIPYKTYVPSVISTLGFPDGQFLKYPSSMGKTLLAYIVKNPNKIEINFDLKIKFYLKYNISHKL